MRPRRRGGGERGGATGACGRGAAVGSARAAPLLPLEPALARRGATELRRAWRLAVTGAQRRAVAARRTEAAGKQRPTAPGGVFLDCVGVCVRPCDAFLQSLLGLTTRGALEVLIWRCNKIESPLLEVV